MKYIELEAALTAQNKSMNLNEMRERLKRIPAAEVRPVVRGEWKEWWPGDCALIMTGEEMLWACSECGSKYSEKQNYCPNCGADMRPEPPKEEA